MKATGRAKRTSRSGERTAEAEPARELNGHISMHCTLGELKARAKVSQYSANRAIMRAAIRAIQAQGTLPEETPISVTFGLKPHPN